MWSWGFRFYLLGCGRRWKTLAGRCPCSCASGAPTPRGRDASGPPAAVAAGGPDTPDQAGTVRADRSEPCSQGLAAPRMGGEETRRPAWGAGPLAGVICPSLPVCPGAHGSPAPGLLSGRGAERTSAPGLPDRPARMSGSPPWGGSPCKRLRAS